MGKPITIALVLALSYCAGCSTITNGSSQDIPIRSIPAGAEVTINGMNRGETPTMVTLRRRGYYMVTLKKTCFEPTDIELRKSFGFSKWLFGNVLFGGIVGWTVDLASGSAWRIKPDEVSKVLQPVNDPQCNAQAHPAGRETQTIGTSALYPISRDILIESLDQEKSSEGLRTIAMHIFEEPVRSTNALDHIADRISKERTTLDPVKVDALAWLCKSLGKSRNGRYKTFLEEISTTAAHKKLRNYAQDASENLFPAVGPIYTAR